MTTPARPADHQQRAAIAVVVTIREVDDPPAWAVEYVAAALEQAAAEGRAEKASLARLIAHDLRLHADEWPLAGQFARRVDALAAAVAPEAGEAGQ